MDMKMSNQIWREYEVPPCYSCTCNKHTRVVA